MKTSRTQAAEACTLEEEQLYNMLCVLGVAGSEQSRKQQVEINKTCFRKPSSKTLEYVMYSLYVLIHGKSSKAAKVRVLDLCAQLEMTAVCTS